MNHSPSQLSTFETTGILLTIRCVAIAILVTLPWLTGCNNAPASPPSPSIASKNTASTGLNEVPNPQLSQNQSASRRPQDSRSDQLVKRAKNFHSELDAIFATQGDQAKASDLAALAIQKAMLSDDSLIANLDDLVAKTTSHTPATNRRSREFPSPIPELFPIVDRWKGESEYQLLHYLDTPPTGLNHSFASMANNEPALALKFYQTLKTDRFSDAVYDRGLWTHPALDEFNSSDRFRMSRIVARVKHADWIREHASETNPANRTTDDFPDLTAEYFLRQGEPLLAVKAGSRQLDKLGDFFRNQSYDQLVRADVLELIKKRAGQEKSSFYVYAAIKLRNFKLAEQLRSLATSRLSTPTIEQLRAGEVKNIGDLARVSYLSNNSPDSRWHRAAVDLIRERVMNSDDHLQLTQSFTSIVLASMVGQEYENLLPYFKAIQQRARGSIYTNRLSYQEYAIQLGCRLALDKKLLEAFKKVNDEPLRNSLLLDLANQSLSPVSLEAAKQLPTTLLSDLEFEANSSQLTRESQVKLSRWVQSFRKGDLDQWLEQSSVSIDPKLAPKVYLQVITSYLLQGRWREAQRKSLEFHRRLQDVHAEEFAAEMVSWLRRFHATRSLVSTFSNKLSDTTVKKLARQGRFDCLSITQIIEQLENGDRSLIDLFEESCSGIRFRAQLKNSIKRGFDAQRSPWQLDRLKTSLANSPTLPLCNFREAERLAAICKLKLSTPRRSFSETSIPDAIKAYLVVSYANAGRLDLAAKLFVLRRDGRNALEGLLQDYHQDLIWIEYFVTNQDNTNLSDRRFGERLKLLDSQQIEELLQRINRSGRRISDQAKIMLMLHGACRAIEESRVAERFKPTSN